MEPMDIDSIEELAFKIANEIEKRVLNLNIPFAEYRRDFDGVSQGEFLLLKMIGEILNERVPKNEGLILIKGDY